MWQLHNEAVKRTQLWSNIDFKQEVAAKPKKIQSQQLNVAPALNTPPTPRI